MPSTDCDCCAERGGGPCPGLSAPFTILEWIGSRTIETDLRTLPLWIARHLDRYHKNNLLWQVVVRGTGDIADGQEFCYAQNRRVPQVWTAPQKTENEQQQLAAGGTPTAGTFTLRRASQLTPLIPFNATAAEVQAAVEMLDAFSDGDVIANGGPLPATPIVLEYTGKFSGSNQPELIVDDDAITGGTIELTTLIDGHTPHAFQNFFEPLNVGTTWHGRLRNGYGDHTKRGVFVVASQEFWNPDLNSVFAVIFFDGTSTETTGDLSVLIDAAGLQSALELLPNIGSGNVSVSVSAPGGCANDLQCGFVVEFIGTLANTDFGEGMLITPTEIFNSTVLQRGDASNNHREKIHLIQFCDDCISGAPNVTAEWIDGQIVVTAGEPLAFALQLRCLGCYYATDFELWDMYEEQEIVCIPPTESNGYSGDNPFARMRRWGIDGFDGHLRNEAFPIDGHTLPRFPPCDAEIVYLGDGSFSHVLHQRCGEVGFPPEMVCDYPEDRYTINPTGDIVRLKELYGTKFSYWGGWISGRNGSNQLLTRFGEYDLSRASVLFLGGLNASFDNYNANQFSWETSDFAAGQLDGLIAWLDQGNKLLVLDGGHFPESLLTALGLATVVHPEGEPIGTDTLISDTSIGPATPPDFEHAHVSTGGFTHPFIEGVVDIFRPSHEGSLGGTSGAMDGRIYTSSIRCLTPGGGAIVIGQLIGEFVAGVTGIPYTIEPYNYPAVSVEPWPGAPTSRIVISYVNDAIAGCDLGNRTSPPVGIADCPAAIMGQGLSHRADATFLRNLWDKRNEF